MRAVTAPVVVGVDASQASRGAARWAADEAVRNGAPLMVLHAIGLPGPFGWPRAAQEVVDDVVAAARSWYPSVDAQTAVAIGSPASVLYERSSRARLVVVGSRGLGGFAGLLLGSVSGHLGGHARCPLLVVHHAERWAAPHSPLPHRSPVVVGVDGSPSSVRALALGFEEAEHRATRLVAVWASNDPLRHAALDNAALAAEIEPWHAKHPDVEVERRTVPGKPVDALLHASTDALMVVVGSRGTGGFAGLRLGSVSQHVLRHANCPVLVARHDDARR